MINNFGDIATGAARRGHLALIVGGNVDTIGSTTGGARMGTSFVRGGGQEGVRGRQALSVQAVARQYTDKNFDAAFTQALPEMVRASGVSARSAEAVTNAIMNNSTLRAQAERAFRAARLSEID